MRLLVSVATPFEARAAVEGGADLIDAKDPMTGALGMVTLATLRNIHAVVGGRRVVSAALGDAADEQIIEHDAFEYGSVGVGFVKIGFAGITDITRVERYLTAAVHGVQDGAPHPCGVVAVAYADTGGLTSVDPSALVPAAARAGAAGVLLDTAHKDGPGLVRLVSPETLTSWVALAHGAGLTAAVAGKVTADDLPWLFETGADIVGVRSAACENERSSRVIERKVRALAQATLTCRAIAQR
jgi:(5-formylfuran-3-yl)methyl phosphate synthase